jgi:PIN domain nuclease of toxin-antitoxin system
MSLLVDTHAFLWFVAGDRRLSAAARRAMEAADGEWWLSAASIWELAIKSAIGRVTLGGPLDDYFADKVRQGLRVLSIDWTHAAAVERLPSHHQDPFDRLIIAQARVEQLAVVTKDPAFGKYGIPTIW